MINYMIVSFYMLCQILLSIIVTTVNYEPPFFFLYSLFTGLFITAEKGLKKNTALQNVRKTVHTIIHLGLFFPYKTPGGSVAPTPGPMGIPRRVQAMRKMIQMTWRARPRGTRLETRVPMAISGMYFSWATARTIHR